MAKTKNLGILGADNIINTRKQITRGTSVKPKKGMKYYDLGKKKKKKDEIDIRTIKNEDVNKRSTLVNNTPNKDGYIKTNKKYGDYDYHDYSTKKNYDIYKKDNKAYYFDPKTKSYVDMDQQRISTPEIEKKEKKKALKEGFKGNEINKVVEKTKLVPEKQKQFGIDAKNNKKGLMKGKKVVESKKIEQVSPRTFAEQVELDTSGLSKKEKKQFTKDLIAQHKKENKKLSYVREGSATGELKNMFVNPNNNFQKEIAQPLADAERIYRQGKLNNELAMQYYNKMEGKKNDIAGAQRKIDLYNKFNRDLTVDKNGNPVDLGLLGNSIQNLNTQVESLKKQGIVATGGSLLGAGIGAVAGLRGGNPLGGAVAGAKIGGKAGYVTGSTPYIYQLEAGNQYKDLLDMGVSDDKAKEISKLTGVINASIESGENIADLVMLGGGKLAKNTIVKNAISKNESVIGKIIKTLGPEKAQNYLERTYGKEIADVLLKSYGANIVSEGTEEALQETVGIAGKRSAANAEGIEYQNTYRDDLNQILNAAKAGAGTAALIGGAQAITTNTASFGTNKLSQMAEVINQTNNGEITQEQANQKFEQINDGTYQQNQNYQTIANQEYQNLQNQLQSGQITDDQYIQELKNLNETINITREQINTSQKEAKMKAMQERIQQMDVNGYISNNYTDKQIQDFMEQVYDDNLSAEELQDNLYNVIFKDSAKKQATNVLEISAKDTNMTRDEFIKRHYTKNMDQEFDVTKEDVGKIYDKYHKKETKKDNYEELKKKAEKEVVKTTSQKSGKKGRSYQGKFFSDDNFNLLDDDDIKLTTKLMKKQENQQKLTKKEEQQAEYLKRKREGLKNPELNPDIKGYSDIKADYKYTSEYKFTKADREKINKALDIVSANKQKRRTKQQWLDVANNIGLQSEKLDSEALKNIAFGSWTELSPNQKEVLNRQGAKYVPFSVDEWVKAVYKGAGVGTKIKEETNQTTQPKQEKTQTNETKPKVETKKVTKMDIQYGDDVKKYDIDIDDIVAINTNRTGTYEDIIVAQGGIDKYINKNVKPNEPTQQDNIPATKSENVISAKTNDGTNIELKKNKDNTYTKEIKQPKDNKSVVPKEVIKNQIAHLEDGTKLSNFYSNITEKSKFITEENAEKLSQEDIWKYAPQTNKETMQKALDDIGDTQLSLERSYSKFLGKETLEAEDIAKGWIFLKRFQDAGNYDAMVQVVKKMRSSGATKAGRTVQMFNLQSRLTPEGMLYYAQSELSEAEQKYNEGKSLKQIEKHAKDFTLTEQETKYIKDQMEKIQNMEDGREKNVEMAKINKMLSDKLPNEKGDWLRAWMRIAMLGNFKTQVRNIGGNAMITPVNALADVPSAIADKAISKFTGVRTIGAPTLRTAKAYAKGFAKGGKEAYQDYKMDIDTKDVDISRFDITQKNPFNTKHKGATKVLNPLSKVGNKTNKLLDLAMSGGDRVFYQGAYEASLRNQMILNNVDTPTQDMIDIARQEALSRTWNDNNDYTNFVLNTRRALNKFSKNGLGSGYGLGDVLIPFAKTPANLTKAIVDYSPVGLASSIFKTKQIKKAIETGQITAQIQHDFAQNLGKGVAGTMLYGLALALAKAGLASGSGDDDKDVANFIKNTMGIQPYSITINGKSFTYDWAQPIAAPLAIVTDATKNLSSKSDDELYQKILNTVMDVSNTGFNVLMQQSFLSGMSNVLNNQEGIVNGMMEQVLSLPARAVPTLFKQINDMFDTTQRSAYERNRPLTTAKQNAMAKTPASTKLAPQVDTLGREIKKYGGDKNKFTYGIKSFLSPANKSNARTSEVADEIYRLYESTGDKTIMPKVAPYYIQNKTVGRIDLSSHDRSEYQKTSGKIVTNALIDLINDKEYKKLNDDKKSQVVNKIVNYADAKAKQKFTKQISSYYAPADRKITGGTPIADYYLDRVKKKR